MEITGPFLDRAKRKNGQPSCWFLRYATPRLNADGTIVRNPAGRPVVQRHRPYYASKAAAEADKPRLVAQHAAAGAGDFLFDRQAATDYEAAHKIVGDVPLVEVAKFWRLHHPDKPQEDLRSLYQRYLTNMEQRLHAPGDRDKPKKLRHVEDLRSRVGIFVQTGFGQRLPGTVTRQELQEYLWAMNPRLEGRTIRNHKNSLSAFFGWIVDEGLISANPLAGIKKRMLPSEARREIRFLSPDEFVRYVRAAERYAPELVAHEIVQLISGVRADDEMDDFRAEYVHPESREIEIPREVSKTGQREVIKAVEKSFWSWWSEYGPRTGLLRPRNYEPRWKRLRVLASIDDRQEADDLARLPIKTLLALPRAKEALKDWPWNARRRTFCTYHVAKYENAHKTALILRHRGPAETLHNSYRGRGITQRQGMEYFAIFPSRVQNPILPLVEPKGIVKFQIFERQKKDSAQLV